MIKTFKKHSTNLKVDMETGIVYSYNTPVAKIKGQEIYLIPWKVNGMDSSPTTSRHINYVAKELNLKLVK